MKHDQRSFGRRADDYARKLRLEHGKKARQVATRCGIVALVFAGVAVGAGLADRPGACLVAFLAAAVSIMVAIAALSEV